MALNGFALKGAQLHWKDAAVAGGEATDASLDASVDKLVIGPDAAPADIHFDAKIDQSLDSALVHHRAGRLREAEAIYRAILAQFPRQPDALHLLGELLNAFYLAPLYPIEDEQQRRNERKQEA